jgi:hypothetical protein
VGADPSQGGGIEGASSGFRKRFPPDDRGHVSIGLDCSVKVQYGTSVAIDHGWSPGGRAPIHRCLEKGAHVSDVCKEAISAMFPVNRNPQVQISLH